MIQGNKYYFLTGMFTALAFLAAGCTRPVQNYSVDEGLRELNGMELYIKAIGAGEPIIVKYTSGFENRMFLSSIMFGMDGRGTKGIADALAKLVMSDG